MTAKGHRFLHFNAFKPQENDKIGNMFVLQTGELFKFNGARGSVEKQYKLCRFWQPVGKCLSQEKQQ